MGSSASSEMDPDPRQEPGELDWEKCANLHNKILGFGWAAVGGDEARRHETWWEYYFGENSEANVDPAIAVELERLLAPSLIKFFKLAWHHYPESNGSGDDGGNFFLYLRFLMSPADILEDLTGTDFYWENPGLNRYMTIYAGQDFRWLMLDQVEMKVVMCDSDKSHLDLFPAPGIPSASWVKWGKFELLLESYVEMVEQGRVFASNAPPESYSPEYGYSEDTNPWYLSQNDDLVVDATIVAWNKLLSAIESRMPGVGASNAPRFYTPASIENCEIKGLFLGKFLRGARIPTFRYVAPGLRPASDEELSNQAFKNADLSRLCRHSPPEDESGDWCYPFLFLRFDQKTELDPSCRYKKHLKGSEYRYNGYPWQHAADFDTGLYITNNSSYDGLYQPERALGNYWAMMWPMGNGVQWNVRLEVLFKNWTAMIEDGHWEVGKDGVLGGAEKFKEADSKDKCGLYFIERTW